MFVMDFVSGGKMINAKTLNKTINEIIKKYPDEKERIKKCVFQVSKLWNKEDGSEEEFYRFCLDNFKTGKNLDLIFERFNENYEYIKGYLVALQLRLRMNLDEDRGELAEIDKYFANLNPMVHLNEDMFKNRIAFLILLNYPLKTLSETIKEMDIYSRKNWATNRMAQKFVSRVPSSIGQMITNTYSKCAEYVYSYNIEIDKVVDKNNKKIFNEKLKLISHWGLRDQIKIYYSKNDEENLNKQRTIYKVMENVVSGNVCEEFINEKEKKDYNPFELTYNGKKIKETSKRYSNLLNIFRAHREEDKYFLLYPNYVDRVFNLGREIPFEETEKLLKEILNADVSEEIARHIESRLKRKLEPFDIWYNGFRDNSVKADLDGIVKKKFPDMDSFQKSIKDILINLDFAENEAVYLSEKIEVDPARGAGHAWGPEMRGEKAHLRTRLIDSKYMNWQGFNTAMHELGHCVEQIYTLYDVDYNLLSGVPNTAFTEAFAFVFQNKSLDILGIKKDENEKYFNAIQTFWDTREIAGVALVDMYIWKWMYEKQKFNEKELRDKVVEIAKDIWNKYYYPVFKVKDIAILGVYSHMIYHGLYLPDYPLGHIIAYQIENYFNDKSIGREMKRICQLGSITPKKWLKEAIDKTLEVKTLIDETNKSLNLLKSNIREEI